MVIGTGNYGSGHKKSVLIIIEDTSYSYDTRVQKIAHTLQANGYSVFVVCPRLKGDPARLLDKGIQVSYYASPTFPDGMIGHLLEYTYGMLAITTLAIKHLFLNKIDIIHICNPPDFAFPIGLFYRFLGKKFIFDQHDLCPELFAVRFGRKKGVLVSLLKLAERLNAQYANHVFVTNDTAAKIISRRTRILPGKITVIRNVPRLDRFFIKGKPKSSVCRESTHIGYLGTMNPQDGLDYLLHAIHYIRYVKGRNDICFVCIGDGGAYKGIQDQARILNIQHILKFTGRLKPKDAMTVLSGCDICVQPDPKNEFNDSCAMTKAFEYMGLGKPVIAFDLVESKVILQEAAIYAVNNSYVDFAEKIVMLADNKELQRKMGAIGRSRVKLDLNWGATEQKLVHAYNQVELLG